MDIYCLVPISSIWRKGLCQEFRRLYTYLAQRNVYRLSYHEVYLTIIKVLLRCIQINK